MNMYTGGLSFGLLKYINWLNVWLNHCPPPFLGMLLSFSSLFMIILTLGLGSSHVSKQSPYQISSSPVSSANDLNCLWNNVWFPSGRRWGLTSVTALFGHSQYSSLVQANHSPWVPSLTAIMTWLPSSAYCIHLHASHPWRVSAQPLWEGTHGTCKSHNEIVWSSYLAPSRGRDTEPWVAWVRISGACDWLKRQAHLVKDAK